MSEMARVTMRMAEKEESRRRGGGDRRRRRSRRRRRRSGRAPKVRTPHKDVENNVVKILKSFRYS